MIAEILLAARAIGANATGTGEPWNTNARADAQLHDASPDCIDAPYDFVARNDRYRGIGEFAIHDVQIRAADAAGGHLDSKLARSGCRSGSSVHSRGAPIFFSVIACMDCVPVWPGIGLAS
jgi:hypothetical protein